MATNPLHFSISGEFLTEHSRNLVIEGRWSFAMETLMDGLMGFPTDYALAVLRGDMKLVGVNDIDIADDDAVDYKAQLAYRFRGVFRDQYGRHLRPYAVITSWGRHDLCDDRVALTKGSVTASYGRGRGGGARNPLIYADDPRTDVSLNANFPAGSQMSQQRGLSLGRHEIVLCKVVDDFPHLILRALGTGQINEAIKELHAAGIMLEERGHSQMFADDVDHAPEPDPATKPKSEAMTRTAEYREGENFQDRVARLNREYAEQQEREERQRAEQAVRVERWRVAILEQAAGDTFPLTYTEKGEKRTVDVPRAPFVNWSLWRTQGANLAPKWDTVCPSGLKMINDDPYHSDWMVGAGIDLHSFHSSDDNDLSSVSFEMNFRLQEEMMAFEAAVLCGEESAYGKVVHPKAGEEVESDEIAVIPNAGPRYLQAALTAKAVVVEQGGAMAHLVTIGRENGVTIMRVENARKLYPVGSKVTVRPDIGKVVLSPVPVRDGFGDID